MRLRGPRQIIGVKEHRQVVDRQSAIARAREFTIDERPDVVPAYVNHGRWLADCPHCRGGMVVHPQWPDARCLDCGAVYAAIAWPPPDDFARIEDLLVVRPMVKQNWYPAEPIEFLEHENAAHNPPAGRR
jgi:hypothetical protein